MSYEQKEIIFYELPKGNVPGIVQAFRIAGVSQTNIIAAYNKLVA
jgi:hypothetical protein